MPAGQNVTGRGGVGVTDVRGVVDVVDRGSDVVRLGNGHSWNPTGRLSPSARGVRVLGLDNRVEHRPLGRPTLRPWSRWLPCGSIRPPPLSSPVPASLRGHLRQTRRPAAHHNGDRLERRPRTCRRGSPADRGQLPRTSWSVPGTPLPPDARRRRWPIAVRVLGNRRGDSKKTIVRVSSANAARVRDRSPSGGAGSPRSRTDRRQTGQRQRGDDCRRTRQGGHPNSRLGRSPNESEAGIADPGILHRSRPARSIPQPPPEINSGVLDCSTAS